MNTSIKDPRSLLSQYGLMPRRSLGQNFLVDSTAPLRIVNGAEVGPTDTVLEVGAGVGTLTMALAAKAAKVFAVETDLNLVSVLEVEMAAQENVTIVHSDILELNPAELLGSSSVGALPLWGMLQKDYLVVANLPYYITAAAIRHLLEAPVRPKRMVVTVQREVAQRIVAQPGDMSLLSVSVQFYGRPRILFRLKRGAFYPVPAVESAVVCVDLYESPPAGVTDVKTFFQVVRAGFAQRRKQLRNTLSSGLHLDPDVISGGLQAVGVAPTRRAETLSILEWGRVVQEIGAVL